MDTIIPGKPDFMKNVPAGPSWIAFLITLALLFLLAWFIG